MDEGSDYHSALSCAREATYRIVKGNQKEELDDLDRYIEDKLKGGLYSKKVPLISHNDILNDSDDLFERIFTKKNKERCISPKIQMWYDFVLGGFFLLFVIFVER